MPEKYEELSLLIKQFNDAAQKKQAFNKAMQKIFERLDDDSMDAFIEEEIKMQKLIDDQERAETDEKKSELIEEYFLMVHASNFKDIRKQISWLEEKYYENAIDDFVEKYKQLQE